MLNQLSSLPCLILSASSLPVCGITFQIKYLNHILSYSRLSGEPELRQYTCTRGSQKHSETFFPSSLNWTQTTSYGSEQGWRPRDPLIRHLLSDYVLCHRRFVVPASLGYFFVLATLVCWPAGTGHGWAVLVPDSSRCCQVTNFCQQIQGKE